jgi:hypothetical protein
MFFIARFLHVYLPKSFPRYKLLSETTQRTLQVHILRFFLELCSFVACVRPIVNIFYITNTEVVGQVPDMEDLNIIQFYILLTFSMYTFELLWRTSIGDFTVVHHIFTNLNIALTFNSCAPVLASDWVRYRIIAWFGLFITTEFPEHFAMCVYRLYEEHNTHQRAFCVRLLHFAVTQEIVFKIFHNVTSLIFFGIYFQQLQEASRVLLCVSYFCWLPAQMHGPFVLREIVKKLLVRGGSGG